MQAHIRRGQREVVETGPIALGAAREDEHQAGRQLPWQQGTELVWWIKFVHGVQHDDRRLPRRTGHEAAELPLQALQPSAAHMGGVQLLAEALQYVLGAGGVEPAALRRYAWLMKW